MSNTDNDTPKPAESGPLDLAEIEARLKAVTPDIDDMTRVSKGATVGLDYVLDDGYNPILAPEAQKFVDHAPTDIAALIQEVKRLRGEVNKLSKSIHDWDNDERGYEIKRFNPPYPEEEE
jgi:hypothetical protein